MLLIFGLGYAARAVAAVAGMPVVGTTRDGRDGTLRFDAADAALAAASHVLSSVPPDADGDPGVAALRRGAGGQVARPTSSTGSMATPAARG
ncbi:hypothetical protein AB5I41_19160 [Sphingomonas sp. MMS24-JH45]